MFNEKLLSDISINRTLLLHTSYLPHCNDRKNCTFDPCVYLFMILVLHVFQILVLIQNDFFEVLLMRRWPDTNMTFTCTGKHYHSQWRIKIAKIWNAWAKLKFDNIDDRNYKDININNENCDFFSDKWHYMWLIIFNHSLLKLSFIKYF